MRNKMILKYRHFTGRRDFRVYLFFVCTKMYHFPYKRINVYLYNYLGTVITKMLTYKNNLRPKSYFIIEWLNRSHDNIPDEPTSNIFYCFVTKSLKKVSKHLFFERINYSFNKFRTSLCPCKRSVKIFLLFLLDIVHL